MSIPIKPIQISDFRRYWVIHHHAYNFYVNESLAREHLKIEAGDFIPLIEVSAVDFLLETIAQKDKEIKSLKEARGHSEHKSVWYETKPGFWGRDKP